MKTLHEVHLVLASIGLLGAVAACSREEPASQKTPQSPRNARVSRILFLANDGSTRFYRDCDALLTRYAQRLLACKLDVTGEELGDTLLGNSKLVRAVLVFDKKFGAQALLALLPPG